MILLIGMIALSPITALIPGLYGCYLIMMKKINIEKNYWNYGMLILFIWYLVSAIVNQSFLSIGGALLLFIYFAMGIIVQNFFEEKNIIHKALKTIVSFTGASALIGIFEKIIFFLFDNAQHRIYSLYGNPNMAGAWFGLNILMLIYLRAKSNKSDIKIYDILLFLIAIALLFTESSGAIISLAGAISAYIFTSIDKKTTKVLMTTIFLISSISVFSLVEKIGRSITVIDEVVGSFNSRYDIWLGSVQMFFRKPILGWGVLGTLNYGENFMYHNGNVIHSHNMYLALLTSGGIGAFIIYMYIKYRIFVNLSKIKGKKLFPLLFSINVMIVIQGLVDCPLYAPQVGMIFVGATSIVNNLANGMGKEKILNDTKRILLLDKNMGRIIR